MGVWIALLDVVLGSISVLLLCPVLLLTSQVVLASWRDRYDKIEAAESIAPRPRVAIVMPAHNESAGILGALDMVLPQLHGCDRLLVVADNCTDDTASVAAARGVEVVERHDDTRRGKGYAVDFGVRHLDADPPDIGVIVDADCIMAPGAIDALAAQCMRTGRAAQALYLMHAPQGAGLKTRLAEFAWIVRNQVRPLGYHRLGWPCQLMGTGMAFPWSTLRIAPLATGHIIEDVKLGLDLASAGAAPMFCPRARVTSWFPSHVDGLAAQRTRWEHGHLGMILSHGPALMWRALVGQQSQLAVMVADLCVPPLASLVFMTVTWLAVGTGYWLAGGAGMPAITTLVALVLIATTVLQAWALFGTRVVSLRELVTAPGYVLSKLPMYVRFWRKRQVDWVRTARDDKPR